MRFVFFVHSLVSDWNHGNAHFIRGIVTELMHRGHRVDIYEPVSSWSFRNLVSEYGQHAVDSFYHYFPGMKSVRYDAGNLDLDAVLEGARAVIVHEWNDHELVCRIGKHRKLHSDYRLFFHDTHHRSATDPESIGKYDLSGYDGVLAFGEVIRQIYLHRSWVSNAWTWHEAADTRIFQPLSCSGFDGEVVWIGNWGDEERSWELREFLFDPVRSLGLGGRVYGVRYHSDARKMLRESGLKYAGWTPNYLAPQIFSRYKLTLHIPRRPYAAMLPGIPTIRPFEALACGIPLICSPWDDCEHLFEKGKDYLVAENGRQMKEYMNLILHDEEFTSRMILHGRKTILDRHTCAHRAEQLLKICKESGVKDTELCSSDISKPESVGQLTNLGKAVRN